MTRENTPYGADSGYHMAVPGLMRCGDTYEEQGIWGTMAPEEAILAASAALDVDKAPISADVLAHIEVAGVELGV